MADDVEAFMATMAMPGHPGERDENCKVTADDGSDYVLKVAHPAESTEVSDLINAALLTPSDLSSGQPCRN